jgi:hypothetical protein
MVSVAATIIPCCSFDDCSEQLAAASYPGKKEQKGTCSPLSVCAGCSIAVIQTKNPVIFVPLKTQPDFIEVPENNNLPLYAASFWQPPRNAGLFV